MVNVNKLKGKMVEHGMSVAQVSEMSGIPLHTLYRRLNAPAEFTVGEATALIELLRLEQDDVTSIFFGPDVAEMQH